jgi:hypothetical protein
MPICTIRPSLSCPIVPVFQIIQDSPNYQKASLLFAGLAMIVTAYLFQMTQNLAPSRKDP